ncbi:MAG TPA: hypothetical protein VH370_27285 [Humisphaera sp.]|jgi:hypothetical protein|nr:hypothetical protein [Humisphaera sp.]
MSLENDIAYFQVDPHQHIAGYPDGQRIELLFDQYGLYGPKPFEKADRWRLVLTADNQLASIELLSPTDVDRSHPKIRALIEAMQTIRSRDAGDAKNQHFAFFASIAPTGMNVTFAASNGPSLSHSLVR